MVDRDNTWTYLNSSVNALFTLEILNDEPIVGFSNLAVLAPSLSVQRKGKSETEHMGMSDMVPT
jgi:hypothetical protein